LTDSGISAALILKIAILEERSSLDISFGVAHESNVADDSRVRLRNMAKIQRCIFL
jgi:hypothetical protein